jgi:phosphosulfolactate synthase (CoM biosynthesis protein A)
MLTSVTRTTPFIVDLGLADFLTFFDSAKLLGFEQITISDGDSFSHQVILK